MKHGSVIIITLLTILAVCAWPPAFAGSDQQQIHQVQKRLDHLGYQPGPRDGRMGPQTRKAIERFQRDHGLPPTGQLDRQTLQRLDKAESGKAESGSAPQAMPADKRPNASSPNVSVIQGWLQALGYHPGPADGQMGPQPGRRSNSSSVITTCRQTVLWMSQP